MQQHPIPVVICSSLVGAGSETLEKALEYGAAEIIEKPEHGTKDYLKEKQVIICDAVKAAYFSKSVKQKKPQPITKKLSADVILGKPAAGAVSSTTEQVIFVGASTGGTEALCVFLSALPVNCPGVVVVQHMPEGFTHSFAERLDHICQAQVSEAENGVAILPGHILIAPGNSHLLCKRNQRGYYVQIMKGPLVSRHRPSIDVLFRSAARYAGKNAIGIIMTGMGDDGAIGLKEMRDAGAYTIAQDEASSVVFGMAKEAIKIGGVNKVMALDKIALEIYESR